MGVPCFSQVRGALVAQKKRARVAPATALQTMAVAAILLCTMVKNEENYLVEWLEFHKLQVRPPQH